MALPLLQIALDNLTIEEAIKSAKKAQKYIDVIEVGTILLASEGKKAITELKKAFPDKIIVADGKIADAGKIFGKMFFDEGADFTTAICACEVPTIKDLVELASSYKTKRCKEIQVEMTSNFTWEQVDDWYDAGATQVVWHRARDAQASGVKWSQKDIDIVAKLAQKGFKVTVTGGVEVADIKLFKDIPIYIFIAGRSIRDAKDPELAAKEFKDEFKKYWK
ncbi:Probable 3-keto-L-gulonate-6-phosphate decarboxylase [Mesomycoplasma conjunctivae]|uniref:3-hexulose-6-phosphate synthase n=1 Tax=Mesomycoplasma conjunctivae (strain ATCC 25834 / NCTC 10147 / HRC/581) TaxID=572263 RepID=C5J658_MESCH|nr:3-keto-L-gulonate-6-phosphate decarboxylase UlaD [Mesomycoplasma conjunctivae]CAT04950.1 3-hexulose-6-phosphate synthase [Mesomycoplasma conjunctivae]VEU66105.1 Probable 3-keto-L-gulonate-6-phosphate decarboxylase [Mesomycoplasma conjunctivae]